MKLSSRDHAILLAAVSTTNQTAIAKAAGVSQSAATHALLRLQKAGALTLTRNGQRHSVTLKPAVASVLAAIGAIQNAAFSAVECILDAGTVA